MSITIEQLATIGRYLNIYLGTFMFVAGLVGALLNLWIFSSRRLRPSPCSRFIFASSCFDLLQLFAALLLRILADGFVIDLSSSHVILCRFRYYFVTFSAYGSIGCRCLAAFDRSMSTSRSISHRQWSSIQTANRLIVTNTLFWSLFALPNWFFFDLVSISSTRIICYISHRFYRRYFAYFVNPILYFALPLILLLGFAGRTRSNLHSMRRRQRIQRLERQMTSMILLQALMNSISSIPYGIEFFYAAITFNSTKDQQRLAVENFFLQITRLSYYMNYISSFYIFYLSSEQIRRIIAEHLTKKRK